MATLNITAPDDKVLRFRAVLGKQLNADKSPATVAQAQKFFVDRMKEYTIDYETADEATALRISKAAEVWQ